MKEKGKKIGTIILVILLIAYFVCLYPLIVYTDRYGETKCKSIIGLSVKC